MGCTIIIKALYYSFHQAPPLWDGGERDRRRRRRRPVHFFPFPPARAPYPLSRIDLAWSSYLINLTREKRRKTHKPKRRSQIYSSVVNFTKVDSFRRCLTS